MVNCYDLQNPDQRRKRERAKERRDNVVQSNSTKSPGIEQQSSKIALSLCTTVGSVMRDDVISGERANEKIK
jgi:hypothetical protein